MAIVIAALAALAWLLPARYQPPASRTPHEARFTADDGSVRKAGVTGAALAVPPQAQHGATIVFYDASIPRLREAITASRQGYVTIPLRVTDPLGQIADELAKRRGISAVHIVTHGQSGQFKINGSLLGHRPGELGTLARIRQSLAPGADILLYGCELAQGSQGRAMIREIARLTGADVAASADDVVIDTGNPVPVLALRTGAIKTKPLSLAGWQGKLWTSELEEGGWYGDAGVPAGTATNHPKAAQQPGARLSTMGDLQVGGPTTSFAVVSVGGATVDRLIHNTASPTSFNTAVSVGNYFKADLVAGGSNGVAITRFQYNQVSANTTGAQMQLALYDPSTNSLAVVGSPITVSGSATALQMVVSSPVGMVPGKLYELRWYGYNCGTSRTCYIDNPRLFTQLNQAPTARNDSFATTFQAPVSGNLITANNGSGADTDPENQTMTIDQINGQPITVGSNISLSSGTLVITNANGAFTFTPAAGFSGTQTFTYRINDGFGLTASATATITVAASTVVAISNSATRYGGGLAYPNIYSVRSGDTINGVAATSANSTLSAVTAVPSQLTFDPVTGNVSAVAGAAPGTYSFTYRICSISAPYDCKNATATVILSTPLTVTKTSVVYADPVNLTTNPKAIPGGLVSYTLTLDNPGAMAIDSSTLTLIDATPPNLLLRVGNYPAASAPVVGVDGTTASGLTFIFSGLSSTTDDVDFSNDNGLTWTYVPVPNANGLDPAVTTIRLRPKGSMGAGKTYSFNLMYQIN